MTESKSLARINARLHDVKVLYDNQLHLARRTRRYSWSLAAGRYVIGLLLISSLFHSLFSTGWLVAFGVLIVVGTALEMRYHPYVKFISAKTHLLQLRRVITTAEQCCKALETNEADGADAAEVVRQVDEVVDEVNRSQQLVYTFIRRPLLDRVLEPFRAKRHGGQ